MSTVPERRDGNMRPGESLQEAFARARRDGLCRFCLDPPAGPDPVDAQRNLCAACMPGGRAPATAAAPATAVAPARSRPGLDSELLEAARSSGVLLSAAHVGDREAIELSLLREAARAAGEILADKGRAPLGPPPLSLRDLANRFHDFSEKAWAASSGLLAELLPYHPVAESAGLDEFEDPRPYMADLGSGPQILWALTEAGEGGNAAAQLLTGRLQGQGWLAVEEAYSVARLRSERPPVHPLVPLVLEYMLRGEPQLGGRRVEMAVSVDSFRHRGPAPSLSDEEAAAPRSRVGQYHFWAPESGVPLPAYSVGEGANRLPGLIAGLYDELLLAVPRARRKGVFPLRFPFSWFRDVSFEAGKFKAYRDMEVLRAAMEGVNRLRTTEKGGGAATASVSLVCKPDRRGTKRTAISASARRVLGS